MVNSISKHLKLLKASILWVLLSAVSSYVHAENRVIFTGTVSNVLYSNYDDGRVGIGGVEDLVELDYTLEIWSLLGQVVYHCTAKWRGRDSQGMESRMPWFTSIAEGVTVKAKSASEIERYIKPYEVRVLVDVGLKSVGGYPLFVCDPGAMSDRVGSKSFNSPVSPGWDELILDKMKSVPNQDWYRSSRRWVEAEQAKTLIKRMFEEFPTRDGKPQIIRKTRGDIFSMKVSAAGFHSEIYSRVALERKRERQKAESERQRKLANERKKVAKKVEQANSVVTTNGRSENLVTSDIFALIQQAEVVERYESYESDTASKYAAHLQQVSGPYDRRLKQINLAKSFSSQDYQKWSSEKRRKIDGYRLPGECPEGKVGSYLRGTFVKCVPLVANPVRLYLIRE